MKTSDKNKKKGSDTFGEIFDLFAGIIIDLLIIFVKNIFIPFIAFLFGKAFKIKRKSKKIVPIDYKMIHKKIKNKFEDEDLGYSINEKRIVKNSEVDFSRHTILFGASGWGKTNLIKALIERYVQRDTPTIYIDPKNSLEDLQSFRKICSYYGKKFYIFSDSYIGEGAINLNPFRDDDVSQNVQSLMSIFTWTDTFYQSRAQFYLMETFTHFATQDEVPDLGKIRDYVFNKFYDLKDAQGLVAQIEALYLSKLGQRLIDNKIRECKTLTEIIEEGAFVYIGLNKSAYKEFAKTVGKMLVNEVLMIAAYRSSISIKPKEDFNSFALITDETSSIIQSDFLDLANKCRSSLIELTCAFQSVSDLENVLNINEFFNILVECFSNYFIFRQSEMGNSEKLSSLVGTFSTEKKTRQTNEDENTERGSARDVEKFYIHPNILKHMPLHRCVYISFGEWTKVHFLLPKNTDELLSSKITISKPVLDQSKNVRASYSSLALLKSQNKLMSKEADNELFN